MALRIVWLVSLACLITCHKSEPLSEQSVAGWRVTLNQEPFAWPVDERTATRISKRDVLELLRKLGQEDTIGDVSWFRFVPLDPGEPEALWLVADADINRAFYGFIMLAHCVGAIAAGHPLLMTATTAMRSGQMFLQTPLATAWSN